MPSYLFCFPPCPACRKIPPNFPVVALYNSPPYTRQLHGRTPRNFGGRSHWRRWSVASPREVTDRTTDLTATRLSCCLSPSPARMVPCTHPLSDGWPRIGPYTSCMRVRISHQSRASPTCRASPAATKSRDRAPGDVTHVLSVWRTECDDTLRSLRVRSAIDDAAVGHVGQVYCNVVLFNTGNYSAIYRLHVWTDAYSPKRTKVVSVYF